MNPEKRGGNFSYLDERKKIEKDHGVSKHYEEFHHYLKTYEKIKTKTKIRMSIMEEEEERKAYSPCMGVLLAVPP